MERVIWGCVLILLATLPRYACGVFTETYAWCVINDLELNKCRDMEEAFNQTSLGQVECLKVLNRYECMRLIQSGRLDLVRVSDTDIYTAVKTFGLQPVARETFDTAPAFRYKAVVVVKKSGPVRSLQDLKDQKSCHTGIGRTVGWTVPVGNLQAKKLMAVESCDNTVKNVATFFNSSCAPGAFEPSNNLDGDNPTTICAICTDKQCPKTEMYGDYVGALKCLVKDAGTVAFVAHSTVDDYIASAGAESLRKDDYRLLCPDGRLDNVSNWDTCSWATRPTDVIVTSPTKSQQELSAISTTLEQAGRVLNASNSSFSLFNSSRYGGKNLLFTDGATGLVAYNTSNTVENYLGEGFVNSMNSYITCSTPTRWCVTSSDEMGKCLDMRAAFASARIHSNLTCVQASDSKTCMEKIRNGQADLLSVDGGDIYTGGRYYNLVPIMSEEYSTNGTDELTSYWAVAVVFRKKSDITLNNLKGKTSCHTGIMKTSGWNVPVGVLIEKKLIDARKDNCDIPKAVGEFFSQSCVPGALEPSYNPTGNNPDNLCGLCGGENKCTRSKLNVYYDYKGSFRCLIEKNADVAFMKHTTVQDYISEGFAAGFKVADFQLLCLDGSRRDVTDWRVCNLARVPSHAVVTSSNRTASERLQYVHMLQRAVAMFGKGPDAHQSGFYLFESPSPNTDLIFQDSAVSLLPITSEKQDYRQFLSQEYLDSVQGIDVQLCLTQGAASLRTVFAPVASLSLCILLFSLVVGRHPA